MPGGMLAHIPYHPSMVYLPTFTYKNHPNAGKYSLHGSYEIIWMLHKNILRIPHGYNFGGRSPPPMRRITTPQLMEVS